MNYSRTIQALHCSLGDCSSCIHIHLVLRSSPALPPFLIFACRPLPTFGRGCALLSRFELGAYCASG